MEGTYKLPVVDMAKLRTPSDRAEVAERLVNTLETVGFLIIDNAPGVDHDLLLRNTKKFFSMSSVEKRMVAKNKWNPMNRNKYRGYFPVETGEISYKEGFEMGQDGGPFDDPNVHPMFKVPNLWPRCMDEFEEFKQDMEAYYRAMIHTGTDILRLLALGSGLDEHWFESMFMPDTLSTLRLLHYPKRPESPPECAVDAGTVVCCKEHSDSGFVTLLSTFHYAGLQIRTEDNQWMDVTPRPNSLIMNIGDVLSKLSNGRFKATKHRVKDTMMDRFSVPFFFEPKYGAHIGHLLPLEKTVPAEHSDTASARHVSDIEAGTKYGPWLIGKMQTFVEFKDILMPRTITTSAS